MLRALVASCGIAAGLGLASTASAQSILHDNGLVAGGGGATESVIEAGYTAFGFSAQIAGNAVLVDDFRVPPGEAWTLDRLKWYGYRTNSTTLMGPGEGAYVTIWDSDPSQPGAQMIWGDYNTTNRYIPAESSFTGIYRVQTAGNGNVARQIQEIVCNLTGSPTLYGDAANGGHYWISFSATSLVTATAVTFCPPINPHRTTPFLDNAVQSASGIGGPYLLLNGLVGGVNGTPGGEQDFPFKIRGTSAPFSVPTPPGTAADLGMLATNGTFSSATVAVSAGNITWVKLTLPAAVDANSAFDLDMEGSAVSDCSFALYDAIGFRKATSYQEGSGDLPMISYGTQAANNLRPRASLSGYNYNGRNGLALPIGTYYVAIASGDQATYVDVYGAVANATPGTGNVTVRARYYNTASLPASFTTPTASHDFGTLPDSSAWTSSSLIAMPKEGLVWMKFTLPGAANISNLSPSALHIDTEGSTCTDTAIYLYSGFTGVNTVTGSRPGATAGFLSNFDLFNGSGEQAQLAYGTGNYTSLANRAARLNGHDSNGNQIENGEYWIAIAGGNSGLFNPGGYDANSSATNTGSVKINIRYISSVSGTAETPLIDFNMGAVMGPDTSLSPTIDPGDVIWIAFNVAQDVPGFALDKWFDIDTAGTNPSTGSDGDTFLSLRLLDGTQYGFDDDDGPGLTSQLTYGAGNTHAPAVGDGTPYDERDGLLGPGDYILGLTMFDNVSGVVINGASNFNFYSHHPVIKTAGTLQVHFRNNFAPAACSPADLVDGLGSPPGDGFVTGTDADFFVMAYNTLLQRPNGSYYADLTDGFGGGPDGFVTGTDADYFTEKYFLGC